MDLSQKVHPSNSSRAWIFHIIHHGKRITSPEVNLYFIKSENRFSKIAILVPKKINKHAVVRNKLRRRAYEIVKSLLSSLDQSINVVISFQKGAGNLSFQELKERFSNLFRQLGVISK